MKLSRVAVISVSALALLAGVFLGLAPVRATLTQVSPELRLLHVTCGNGYLRVTPPERPDALVELPGEPGVFLQRTAYDAHCSAAMGWQRYAAWGLTALGVLGLALTFATGRTTPLPSPEAGGGAPLAKRGRGGAHRARAGGSGTESGNGSGKDAGKSAAGDDLGAKDAGAKDAGAKDSGGADSGGSATEPKSRSDATDDAGPPGGAAAKPAVSNAEDASSGSARPGA